jgi:hypothetical protein
MYKNCYVQRGEEWNHYRIHLWTDEQIVLLLILALREKILRGYLVGKEMILVCTTLIILGEIFILNFL